MIDNNNKMVQRHGRGSTFILVGLLLTIFVLAYNYWQLMNMNKTLNENLIQANSEISEVRTARDAGEKQNEICSERIKFFEERIETNQQSMKMKDNDLNDLSAKLKDLSNQVDRLKQELEDSQSKSVRFVL